MPLANALAESGHMVRVVIPPWDDPSARDLAKAKIETNPASSGGGFVEVVTLTLPRRLSSSLALTYGLVRWAVSPPSLSGKSHFRAEVAHVFKPVGYSGLAGLVLQALRVPWVLDTDDWEGPGGWTDVNRYSLPQKAAVTLLEAMLPRMAGAVTAASRTLEARAWSFGLTRDRAFYLPNGVSREKYGGWSSVSDEQKLSLRARYGLTNGPVILLYTRFAEFPYRWPLQVLKQVLKDHPTTKLLVVGTGFFREEEKLRQEAMGAGIGEKVVITGYLPEAELPAHLALADVALYPMRDNLINRAKSPMKLLEQMVIGLPVVAHNVGQVPHFLVDTGLIVESGSLRDMSEAVSLLLGNPELRRQLGAKAQERVWAEFIWERLSEVAERAYEVARRRVAAKQGQSL
jgi:glycosyltransferase involved in cell wall biosynthesis